MIFDRRILVGVLLVQVVSPAAVTLFAQQFYNATEDFSVVSNENVNGVWSYRQGVNSNTLIANQFKSPNSAGWRGSISSPFGNFPYVLTNTTGNTIPTNWTPDMLGMHPASDGTESVLRWTSPNESIYLVEGRFQDIQNATADVSILLNNQVVVEDALVSSLEAINFDLKVSVTSGDFLEFAVGRGNDGFESDAVGLLAVLRELILGDVNLDGAVDLLDVSQFVDRLSTGSYQDEADINCDGEVNLLDVAPFIAILAGG